MNISQKCQYGLRAVLELSLRIGRGPVKTGDIAKAQSIPLKFLEVILVELKHGGFVESRRGHQIHGAHASVSSTSASMYSASSRTEWKRGRSPRA